MVQKELGNDVNISFWKDWWIGEQPLYLCFPQLVNLLSNNDLMLQIPVIGGKQMLLDVELEHAEVNVANEIY